MNPLPAVMEWPRGRLDFSGGPLLMGILNVTPDSFSDGGRYVDPGRAVAHGLQMAADGAAILDVGPESTRPGSKPVPADEQIRRAVPVIERLVKETRLPVSIDTRDPLVARAAADAGEAILNGITALADDSMKQIALRERMAVVLMHMQGTPETMQRQPRYTDVVGEVTAFLAPRAQETQTAGLPADRIILDPGIGFGKTMEHNLSLLKHLDAFAALGYRLLVGPSRKGFIGRLTGKARPADCAFGTAATVALAVSKGAHILRVHDVAQMADVIKVAQAVASAP